MKNNQVNNSTMSKANTKEHYCRCGEVLSLSQVKTICTCGAVITTHGIFN